MFSEKLHSKKRLFGQTLFRRNFFGETPCHGQVLGLGRELWAEGQHMFCEVVQGRPFSVFVL
jgi:hypothetical protein